MILPYIEQSVYVRIGGYGPVRGVFMAGDGSVRTITDGTSNTITFGETPAPRGRGATDGTSNTITFGETPPRPGGGSRPGITDGTSNTIVFGETPPRTGGITDGSSNTIVFGETPRSGDGSVRHRRGGSNVLMGDGSVRFQSPVWTNPKLLRGLMALLLPARLSVLFPSRNLDLLVASTYGRGLQVKGAHVLSMKPVIFGRTLITLESSNIIAILIGL